MNISRRKFLTGLILAPAIVKAENLMKIWTPKQDIIVRGFDLGDCDQGAVFYYEFDDNTWAQKEIRLIEKHDIFIAHDIDISVNDKKIIIHSFANAPDNDSQYI